MKKLANIFAGVLLFYCGCSSDKDHPENPPQDKPAHVDHYSNELELATVRLNEKAMRRLGIAVVKAERAEVTDRRFYPGVVVVSPENRMSLLAPVSGLLHYEGPAPLAVGTRVSQGQRLFSLEPLQTTAEFALGPAQLDQLNNSKLAVAQSVAAVQTRIELAQAELKAAQIEEERAARLFESKVGSRKRVDDAVARVNIARQSLLAARREKATILKTTQTKATPRPEPLSLSAPLTGSIIRCEVVKSQAVGAGQFLLEVANLARVLVRVRVPISEVKAVRRETTASIVVADRVFEAVPVRGLPTADQLSATLDLYYEVEPDVPLSPDQRVEAHLPLNGVGSEIVLPKACLLYDHDGGTWVYAQVKAGAYRRKRVLLKGSSEKQIVVASGVAPGESIVKSGAAELFGIEFGNE